MTRFEVLLTDDAQRDIEEIYDFIATHDGVAKAGYVLERFDGVIAGLKSFPQRGSFPRELLSLGIREYRQTLFKPYRLIYRIIDKRVYVYLVADGRRDMQTLLTRRLLGA